MPDPLTDARLDTLASHAEYGHLEGQDYDVIADLVAEVRRLRVPLRDIASRGCLGRNCSGRSCATCVARVALGDADPSQYQENAGYWASEVRRLRAGIRAKSDTWDQDDPAGMAFRVAEDFRTLLDGHP